jgi:Peptidase family S41
MLRNIGILKVPFFSGAFGIRFSKLLDAAVESLKAQGCDRLIIDLRGCLGGSLDFARLVSYLCPDRIPIGCHSTTAATGVQTSHNSREFQCPVVSSDSCFVLRAFRSKTNLWCCSHKAWVNSPSTAVWWGWSTSGPTGRKEYPERNRIPRTRGSGRIVGKPETHRHKQTPTPARLSEN